MDSLVGGFVSLFSWADYKPRRVKTPREAAADDLRALEGDWQAVWNDFPPLPQVKRDGKKRK